MVWIATDHCAHAIKTALCEFKAFRSVSLNQPKPLKTNVLGVMLDDRAYRDHLSNHYGLRGRDQDAIAGPTTKQDHHAAMAHLQAHIDAALTRAVDPASAIGQRIKISPPSQPVVDWAGHHGLHIAALIIAANDNAAATAQTADGQSVVIRKTYNSTSHDDVVNQYIVSAEIAPGVIWNGSCLTIEGLPDSLAQGLIGRLVSEFLEDSWHGWSAYRITDANGG